MAAESKILHLESQVERLREISGRGAESEISEEARFRTEVDGEVQRRGEVDGGLTRSYHFGPQFLARLESQGPAFRTKAVKACADVIMNSPGLLKRREDHPLRSGSGGNDPQILRPSDGARARRCALELNRPSARRIHYWVLGDGSVELATVNLHDDMTI